MKPKQYKELLTVKLTEDEIRKYSLQLAKTCGEKTAKEEEKAKIAERINSELKLMKQTVDELSTKVETGEEDRLVECEERPVYDLGVIRVVRLDTLETVRERPMSAQDRQARMFEDETGGLRNEFLEDRDAAAEEQQSEEERERVHAEAVAKWRREPEKSPESPKCVCGETGAQHDGPGGVCGLADCGCTEFRAEAIAATIKPADDQADDFTAPICEECRRIDGGHAPTCSKSDALTHDDYLGYARAHFKTNHQSHARKMGLTKLNDDQVRAWKAEQQAADGKDTKPEPAKTKRSKLSPVEAAIDR